MATVLEGKPTAAARYDARVRGEIGKATGRIRANDAVTGAASLAVLTLAYAVGGILLDQWFDLPRFVRQLGFAGFLTAFAAVGYFLVVRPLRRAVNPRFAARRIEATAPGAKNAVINWVDLQDRPLPDGVRAAVAVKAADGLADADVTTATASRPLAWLGTAAGLLVVTLAVLLVVCKPAQFFSLLGRTFNPFTTARIASRTQITLTAPATGDVTVTTGDVLTVAVGIGGKVPGADGSDRVRLQFKYTPDATEYDELPLAPAENPRDYSVRVPDYVVQNGFWYRVAAGDSATPEYRVTVRNRPLFKGFEARYEYPPYLRMAPDVGRSPNIDGYRGTTVTLTAKTNRALKSGRMQVAGRELDVIGKVVGEGKGSLEFRFPLTESGSYQLRFTSASDEPSDPSATYPITVIPDRPPVVEVTTPKDAETALPADGLLAVDGTVGDDFGIDRVTLHARVIPAKNDAPIVLPPKPFRDRSFRRAADGSFPTSLEYKDSLPLSKLKDSLNRDVVVKEGSVVEFWLEAADNCTEPTANVGKSKVYRVTLEKPAEAKEFKDQQNQEAATRKLDEQQFQKQQDQKLDTEKREPSQPPKRADAEQPQQPAEGQQSGEPGERQQTDGKQPGDGQPTDGKQPGEGQPTGGQQKPEAKAKPDGRESGSPMGEGTPQTDPNGASKEQPSGTPDPEAETKPGSKPDDNKLQKEADRVQQALKEQPGQQPPGSDPSPKRPGDDKQSKPTDGAKGTGDPKQEQGSTDPKPSDPKPGQPNPGQPDGTGERRPTDGNTPPDPSRGGQPSGRGQPSDGDPQQNPASDKPLESGELDRLLGGKNGQKLAPPKETVERLTRDADDLANPDPQKQKEAEKKFDDLLGKKDRERLQQATQDKQSGDPAMQEKAKEDVDELTKKSAKKETANDLTSPDDAKRQAAEKSFDQGIGKENREKLQDAMMDMKSGNQKRMKDGLDKLKDMAKGADGKPPTPEQMKELADAANDLASDDPAKRKAAEQKLDQQIGKDMREEMQKTAKDLKSSDPATRQAAADKLKEMAEKAGKKSPGGSDAEQQAVKDAEALASDNPADRKAAEEKFDKSIGKEQREKLQQAQKDAKSGAGTPEQQKAAKEKADQMANDAAGKPSAGDDTQKRPDAKDELAKAANDLGSPDDAKRKAAEEKFDKAMGKDAREKLQQDVKDKQSGDPAQQQAADERVKQKLDEMAKKDGGKPDPKAEQAARERAEKLADAAKNLTSDDPAKREAAEKTLDDAVGKDLREKAQQLAKDVQSDDPKKAEEAKRTIDEMMKEAMKRNPDDYRPNGTAGDPGPDAKPIDGDLRDRLKSAEQQLRTFKEVQAQYGDEHKKKLGYSKEEFDAFVRSHQEMVERMKAEVTEGPEKATPTTGGPHTTRVGESGVAGFQGSGPAAGPRAAGFGAAPPGFADAQRRFAEEAAKRGRK